MANPEGINGIAIMRPGDWSTWGVEPGDVLASTNITGGLSSPEARHKALSAPEGTEIIVIRKTTRIKIVLGKGIIQKEEMPS
jgi:hypothetical protein